MKTVILAGCVLLTATVGAQAPQSPAPKPSMPAVDVTAADITKFIDALPKDAILHDVTSSEIYYMLEGAATLVTGGAIAGQGAGRASATSTRGSRIDGGVSRRLSKGDVVIIPPRTPHWWTNLESDLRYIIFRPDPASRSRLR